MNEAILKEIQFDKSIRRDLDVSLQILKSLPPSDERALSIIKIKEAIMWLGMDLKRINEENPGASPTPYPHSMDPNSPRIEPTADGLKL